MRKPEGLILVIFGASGDLTSRKLIPALCDLDNQNLLADNFAILGTGRTEMNENQFRDKMAVAIDKFADKESCLDQHKKNNFLKRIFYMRIDGSDPDEYARLADRLAGLDKQLKTGGNYLYYLATPPVMYESIVSNLSSNKLNSTSDSQSWRRIVVEKPFGSDLLSAQRLNKIILQVFSEDQIFRIDHYLGKETVQNILVTRFSNGIFEPLWNRNFIERVEISSSESIGIENRGGYYDNAGALRDMVQNHLLQLVGLIAMEPPVVADATSIRNETLKVFQALRQFNRDDIEKNVIRGQYTGSVINNENIPGYRDEPGIVSGSRTETYVAMKFYVDNWRWNGVPFYLRTGKRLPIRVTEVVIHFKPSPHTLFAKDPGCITGSNQLIIRIQPDEGILLKFGMKVPGSGYMVKDVGMDFHYSDLSDVRLPDAYERLLLDCMLGDATLFARGDAVEATWQFIYPILRFWNENSNTGLFGYPAGTWGPENADKLIEGTDQTWRYPCKNLTAVSSYCEL
ncbi:MAG TPA: glucose-6-phosphate dehydrogenase [Bacteroidales bacterium]|nr:glucose-6-phosphate dehydrogenase [Bacteroidales bacterium]